MHVIVSHHAERELLRRSIPQHLFDSVLNAPQQQFAVSGAVHVLQSKLRFDNGKMYLLRVFVAIDRQPPLVLTAYRTSRIAKYWRAE